MEDHERNALAAPPADFCDLNAICESAARIGKELAELPCDENSPAVSEGIVVRLAKADNGKCTECGAGLRKAKNLKDVSACPKCGKLYSMSQGDSPRWFIWEKGMATFVARRIAHKWAQPAGDVYNLGEVNQRDVFFSVFPPSQFFKAHNSKLTTLIVGNSGAEIPDGWSGKIAFFNELFYYHDRELRISPNIHGGILPRAGAGLRRGKNRVIHERRDAWLRFLVWLFAKPYDPKQFFRGAIRRNVVCDWFKRNIPGAPTSPKTYKRDYDCFRTYHGKPGEHDFRESAIILLLKQAADPKFGNRMETAQAITNLLVQLKEGETKMGHPIEISSEWQYTGDKRGTRTLVAVSTDKNPIDDMEF